MLLVGEAARGRVARAEVEHADRTGRPVDAVAVTADVDVQELADQQPQHRLVRHHQHVARVVARAQIFQRREGARRHLEGRLAGGRADRRILAPPAVTGGIAGGRFLLRQALPLAEEHLVQPGILPDRQRETVGERLRRGDRRGAACW